MSKQKKGEKTTTGFLGQGKWFGLMSKQKTKNKNKNHLFEGQRRWCGPSRLARQLQLLLHKVRALVKLLLARGGTRASPPDLLGYSPRNTSKPNKTKWLQLLVLGGSTQVGSSFSGGVFPRSFQGSESFYETIKNPGETACFGKERWLKRMEKESTSRAFGGPTAQREAFGTSTATAQPASNAKGVTSQTCVPYASLHLHKKETHPKVASKR